jgi:hypothetical protein
MAVVHEAHAERANAHIHTENDTGIGGKGAAIYFVKGVLLIHLSYLEGNREMSSAIT